MNFCSTCLIALHELEEETNHPHKCPIPHHRTISEFLDAVSTKCRLCWRTWHTLNEEEQHQLEALQPLVDHCAQRPGSHRQTALEEALMSQDDSGSFPRHALSLAYRIAWPTDMSVPKLAVWLELDKTIVTQDALDHQFRILELPSDSRRSFKRLREKIRAYELTIVPRKVLNEFPRRIPDGESTGSEPALNIVSKWLSDCTQHHPKCSVQAGSFYPTRLLDIANAPDTFCIVDGPTVPKNEPYVTLSHRWGSSSANRLLLTRDNIANLRAGFPVCGLSKIFQEAILVTRYLSIRYIWIDSLCIIQAGDYGDDWRHEVMQMDEVYKYAYLNIAADNSNPSSKLGMFFPRDSDLFAEARLITNRPIAETDGVTTDWISIDRQLWEFSVDGSPLNKRGWVFQERVLSPRIVHFCQGELFWECREQSRCESFPDRLPPPELFDLLLSSSLRRLDLWEGSEWLRDERFPREDILYEVWDDMIKQLSDCDFTYPRDKLVAISGVARHLKGLLKDQFLAGMWRRRLKQELGWWVYPRREKFKYGQEPEYYAPSFSWASVKGQVNSFGPFALGLLVDVVCVSLQDGPGDKREQVFTEDVFGPLDHHKFQLRVTGDLKPFKLRKGELKWYMRSATMTQGAIAEKAEVSSSSIEPYLDFDISDEDQSKFEEQSFYFIPWRDGPGAGEYEEAERQLHCILLKIVDKEKGQFRRIGWAICWDQEMRRFLEEQEPDENMSAFFNNGIGQHVVYVI